MSYSDSDEDSWASDEPPPLDINLEMLRECAAEVLSMDCVSVTRITRGMSHEVFLLEFSLNSNTLPDAGSGVTSCIARCARTKAIGVTARKESEIATIQFLKEQSTIPVPTILYYNLDPGNSVGASFVLMEKLPGRHLYKSWDELDLPYKKEVLTEIASVVSQLARLRFDKIGSLRLNKATPSGVELGPVLNICYESSHGPFDTSEAFLHSFVETNPAQLPELQSNYQQIRSEISNYLASVEALFFRAPFVMIHGDFDAQNMLFTDTAEGPRLTGLLDFEFSFTGPRYFLYEHPIFIQDVSSEEEKYAENALLRAHFVQQIFDKLPEEDRPVFIACMNAKTFIINRFEECFMYMKCSEKTLLNSSTYYLKSLRDGTGRAYSGRLDYQEETYSEDGKMMDST